MVGVVVLVLALVASVLVAGVLKWRNGRFVPTAAAHDPDETVLTADTIGAPLGRDATLVQFSSSFCTPCRATRALLTDIAQKTDGVETVEINAEERLELVRELGIMRTPTVVVLGPRGQIVGRAGGLPKREQVMAALAAVPSS